MEAKDTVMSDAEIETIVRRTFPLFGLNEEGEEDRKKATLELLHAQRDADVEWYEKKRIEWTRMDRDWLRIVKGWRRPGAINTLVQQAKAEIAREILKEISYWKYVSPANLYQFTMNEIIEKLEQSLKDRK